MKKRVTLFLIAIIMLIQPFVATLSLAIETTNTETGKIFNDDALYQALKELLGEKASYIDEENKIEISNEKIQEVTKLILENKQIKNLTGLSIFTNLKELDLSGNELDKNSNLEELNFLVNLTNLDLSSNKIEDVSSLTSLLSKENLETDLQGQEFKTFEFIDTIKVNTEEVADSMLNGEKQIQELPSIFSEYENTVTEIKELKINGIVVSSENVKNYISINNETASIEIIPQEVNKYEITAVINSDVPTNKTKCTYKLFKIDMENQTGIVFKDENLYKAVRDQLKKPTQEGGYGYTSWIYDDEDLVVVANKYELDSVDAITVNAKSVKDLTGLEKFVGLKNLNLEDNSVIDLNIISQLYINKNARTQELKAKYDQLVSELKKYLTDNLAAKEEIKKFNDEIKAIQKAIANGEAANTEETVEQKLEKISKNEEKIQELTTAIQSKVDEINSLLERATGYGISNILTSPLSRKNIEELCAKLEENKAITFTETTTDDTKREIINEEISLLGNNRLEELVNLINASLNNLTDDELANIILDENLTVNGSRVITETDKARIEANYSKDKICDYIDTLKEEEVNTFVETFNTALGSTIKTKETITEDGVEKEKAKAASVIKSEMKIEVNNKYTSSENIDGYGIIIDLYESIRTAEESTIAEATKETVIEEFKTKLSEKQQEISNELNESIRELKTTYVTGTSIYYNELRVGLNLQAQKLLGVYDDLNSILENDGTEVESIIGSVIEKDAVTGNFTSLSDENKANLLDIANRLSQVLEEEKNEVIKAAELETLVLDRNIISDVTDLQSVPTIKNLYLNNNIIETFDFSKFDNLEELYLSGNCLKEVEITEMTNLEILDLSQNRIDNIDKINLLGLQKIENINLDDNEIEDIEKLLASKNAKLIRAGYETLADYLKANPAVSIINISIRGQELSLNLEFEARQGKTSEEIQLPKIFAQVKALQNDGIVRVVYEKAYPCTNVYSDGTKANVDVTALDVKKTGIAIIDMNSNEGTPYFADGTVCRVNYIVNTDVVAPVISRVEGNAEDWTKEDVTLTVSATDDKSTVLSYSFDNGNTWQETNTKVYSENTNDIKIKVKDEKGNISEVTTVSIAKIDKILPTITEVSGISTEKTDRDVTLTVVATDSESGIAGYSFDDGNTWQESNSKTYAENTNNIKIKVKDNAGNIASYDAVSISNIDKTTEIIPDDPETPETLTITSSVYAIDATGEYIGAIPEKVQASAFKANITNNATDVTIRDEEENVLSDDELIGTGMTIEYTLGTQKETRTLIVKGDATGDGKIDFADIAKINSYRLGKTELSDTKVLAADVDNDTEIKFADIAKINSYRLGKINSL